MYDDADVPSVQSLEPPPSSLSKVGGAMSRATSGRLLGSNGSNPESLAALSLPKSTLRKKGGAMAISKRRPLFQQDTDAPLLNTAATFLDGKRGSLFGRGNTMSYIDKAIYKGASNPGPGDYNVQIEARRFGVGKFNKATRHLFASKAIDTGPGPSEYGPLPTHKSVGTSFGTSQKKTRAIPGHTTPSPMHYNIASSLRNLKGVKISSSELPSEADLMIRRRVPGPGAYRVPLSTLCTSGTSSFSESNIPSELERIISRSKETPGPGAHITALSVKPQQGGKISEARPKSEIDWIELRSSQAPGPGSYMPKDPSMHHSTSGKFSLSKTMSVIERAISRASKTPAPSHYSSAPNAKDFTMRKSLSASFVLRSKAGRFEPPAKEEGIRHPRWREFPAVPIHPGERSAPSHTMGQRFSPTRDRNISEVGPGSSLHGVASCGKQVLSQNSSAPAFAFAKGSLDDNGTILSPAPKYAPGPADYNCEKAWKRIVSKQSGRGPKAHRRSQVAKARINLWKWRMQRNF